MCAWGAKERVVSCKDHLSLPVTTFELSVITTQSKVHHFLLCPKFLRLDLFPTRRHDLKIESKQPKTIRPLLLNSKFKNTCIECTLCTTDNAPNHNQVN